MLNMLLSSLQFAAFTYNFTGAFFSPPFASIKQLERANMQASTFQSITKLESPLDHRLIIVCLIILEMLLVVQ